MAAVLLFYWIPSPYKHGVPNKALWRRVMHDNFERSGYLCGLGPRPLPAEIQVLAFAG